MANSNRLPKIVYDSQDFEQIVSALQEYIRGNYSQYFNDFFTSNLGQALIELLAYIGDQLNYYMNKKVNNLYIETTERYDAMLMLSRLLGYSVTGPVGAKLNVCSRRDGVDAFTEYPELILDDDYIKVFGGYWLGQTYYPGESIVVDDLTFEVLNDVFIYKVIPVGPTPSDTIRQERIIYDPNDPGGTMKLIEFYMYEGKTNQDKFTSDGVIFQKYESNYASVIDGSWKLRVNTDDWDQATDNTFVNHVVGDKVYTVDYIEGLKIRITFGDGVTYGEKPNENDIVNLVYRVGGGLETNIAAEVLDPDDHTVPCTLNPSGGGSSSEVIQLDNDHFISRLVLIYDYGGQAEFGAAEQEIESIRIEAPQYMKSTNRAITLQDIQVLALTFQDTVSGEQVFKASVNRPEQVLRYVGPDGTLKDTFTAGDQFILYEGHQIPIYLPSYGANIIRVFIWSLGTEGEPISASVQIVSKLSIFLNKGTNNLGEIPMVSVHSLVNSGDFKDIVVNLNDSLITATSTDSGIWYDPVFDPEVLSIQIKTAIVTLFNGLEPGQDFLIMDIWRVVSAIEGILKFKVQLDGGSGYVTEDIAVTVSEIARMVDSNTDIVFTLVPKV